MTFPRVHRRAPRRWRDGAVASAWLIALEVENATIGLSPGWEALGALLVAAMALASVLRRRSSLTFLAVALALGSALVAVWSINGVAENVTITPLYVVIFVPYAGARESSRRVALVALAATLLWASGLNAWTGPTPATSYVITAAVVVAAWVIGRWLRARQLLNAELARTKERIDTERDSRIRLAVADERTRIARELHALIAGNVTAMVIQAEAAELMLATDPIAADGAMAAVEQTGRDALSEMRRMLGILRLAEESTPVAPQPGVGQVYALIEAAREDGRSIELSVEGEPGPLAASVNLAIYRILEEALEDSRPDRTSIQLGFMEDRVELTVHVVGSSTALPWPTLAMRERAAICRGAVMSHTIPHSRRLTVSLPRSFEEVAA